MTYDTDSNIDVGFLRRGNLLKIKKKQTDT